MFFIGIDWADTKFDICIIDSIGNVLAEFVIKKNVEGFIMLLEKLREYSQSVSDFKILIETPHSLIVDFLHHHGYPIWHINPNTLKSCRERYRTSKAKSDKFDAFVLADVMRTDHMAPIPFTLGSELSREIAILTSDLRGFIREKTALSNKLIATIKEYYLVFNELFSNIICKSALQFLIAYPTYEEAKALSEKQFINFFKKQDYRRTDRLKEAYKKLKETQISIEPVIIRTKSKKAVAIATQLLFLLKQIKEYENDIESLLDDHPDKEIFSSIPGAGKRLAPELIAHFGDNRDRFNSYVEIQRLAGSAPVTKQSGNYRGVTFRFACNKKFRKTLQILALCSLTKCLWARKYYDKQIAKGKTHHHALRCLANKWVKIIFKMWKEHQKYDDNRHLADIAKQKLLANT